jgi:nucleoside-diphosphate-sugar epimerase
MNLQVLDPPRDFVGQVAIITGGAGGVGTAVAATLARRGVTQAFRDALRKRVLAGEEAKAPPALPPSTPPSERLDALRELHAWLSDWSECARGVITRRDQLLRLGIGKRAAKKRASTPPPADASVAHAATNAA